MGCTIDNGSDFDLDANALAVTETNKIVSDDYFVFFNNKSSPEGAIMHHGGRLPRPGKYR